MSIEILKKSLMEAPIIKKGDYDYVIHPITDGVPKINPELLKEVANEIQKLIESCGKIDRIVTMEAMGIPIASAISLKMNIPFTIIRKREYGLPGEVSVQQVTGYSKSKLYINGLKKGDRIVIVDDVLSTGGTLKAVITVLKKIGVTIKGIFIAIDKGNVAEKIKDEYDVNIKTLVNIDVIDGKVLIKNEFIN
jgi:adenine phosphoribosyltransferase